MSFSPSKYATTDDSLHSPADTSVKDLKQQVPAWAMSVGVHLALMLVAMCIARPIAQQVGSSLTTVMDDRNQTPEQFDATITDVVGTDGDDLKHIGNGGGGGTAQSAEKFVPTNTQEDVKQQIDEKFLRVEVPSNGITTELGGTNLLDAAPTSGNSTENAGGVEGSMDRITFEIAASLKEHKTLVVWLFDASLSLKERRNAIADRFENIYKQLGQLNVTSDKALKTAAAAFGEKINILTDEPVDDVRNVAEKVRNIKDDVSGKENTLTAVMTVANKFLPYRQKMHRNVMIIIVTDERGDDWQNMEASLQQIRRYGMKVYCVGNAAIFGREKGFVSWKYEDGTTEDLPVDQGPESVYPERVEMPFFGVAANDLNYMSAGYGPYALTRLCAETGGLYLITDESKLRFDPLVMKNYRPDYRPMRKLDEEVQKNRAKMALIEAAKNTSMKDAPIPQLVFRADTDNAVRQEATAAQKPAAERDFDVQRILQVLEAGEKDRDKLDTPRWRASYDLAMGRALAMRVRYFGYNKMLAEMKVAPKAFQTAGNNRWEMKPTAEITSGPDVKKLEKRAREYLNRVIDTHPGTPWALLAERELSVPMGWEWKESHADYAKMDRDAAERRAIQLAEEEERKKDPKKMQPKPKPKPQL